MAIDVSVTGTTAEQRLLAITLVGLVFVALAILRYRLQNTNLPSDQKREKRTLLEQREARDPESVRIPADADLPAMRGAVTALFDTDTPGEAYATPLSAAGEIRAALGTAYRDYTAGVPRLSLAMIQEGLLVALLGALAVVPTAEFARLFASGGDLSLGQVLNEAAEITVSVVTTGFDVLTTFPYVDILYAFALAYTIEFARLLYEGWFVTAPLLFAGAGGIWWLTTRVPDDVDTTVYDSHTAVGGLSIAVLAVVWVVGVVPAAVLGALGFPEVGAAIGFILATAVGLWLAVQAVVQPLIRRLRWLGEGRDMWDPPVAGFVVLRWISVVFVAILAPIVVAYLGTIVLGGKFIDVAAVFLEGSVEMQVVVLSILGVVAGFTVLQTRAAWPEVRASLRESLARRAVRVALARRVMPVGVVFIVYMVISGFGFSFVLALMASIAAGVAARILWGVFQRAKYRSRIFFRRDPVGAARVVVLGYALETAEGDSLYLATVNTVELVHTDRDALVNAILETAAELFEDQSAPTRFEQQFAEDAFRYGIVDVGRSRKKLRRTVDEETFGELALNGGRMPVEDLHNTLEDYPEPVWTNLLQEWRREGRLRERNGQYIKVG